MLLAGVLFSAGCATAPRKGETVGEEARMAEQGEVRTVIADRENLRRNPNGKIIGEAHAGESFAVLERRGNWCRIEHAELGNAWIWGPSLGLEQVNILSLPWLLGGDDQGSDINDIIGILGEPSEKRRSPDLVEKFRYRNALDDGTTLFGTKRFTSLELLVDIPGGKVLRVEILLPPFSGNAKELLAMFSLPAVRASGQDFERARYNGRFPGISRLDLVRYRGDFNRFSRVVAWKLPNDSWQRYVTLESKKAERVDAALNLTFTLKNSSGERWFAGPVFVVEIFNGGKILGNWRLGPGALRLGPGETADVRFPVPVDASVLDPATLNLTAELAGMTMVPVPENLP